MALQNFLKSKFATVLLFSAMIFVLAITGKILLQKRVVDKEIAKLKAQAESVQKDNEQLSGLIKYLDTPEYQEKQAREKLNLKKEGEYVVVLPTQDQLDLDSQPESEEKANFSLWFNYFFNHAQ